MTYTSNINLTTKAKLKNVTYMYYQTYHYIQVDPKLKTNETNFLFLFSYTCNNNRKNLHVIENGQDISLSFIIIPSNSHSFAAATSRSFDHHRVTNFISYPNCILIILQKHYKLK